MDHLNHLNILKIIKTNGIVMVSEWERNQGSHILKFPVPARGLAERCEFPNGVWDGARAEIFGSNIILKSRDLEHIFRLHKAII